jgi:SAM-dependent methyltransferase
MHPAVARDHREILIKTYQELFDQRGSAYDRAMRRYPDARRQEFEQAVAAAGLGPGMVVADVPAGGGYLQAYLPPGCTCLGHEPCASFTNHGAVAGQPAPLLPLPWGHASVDAAISLAGVHHLDDKRPLFSELRRVVRPGGRLVVSDVATASAVARFLDGYVGGHNSTGHEGAFLDERTLRELAEAGWIVEKAAIRDFQWVFPDRTAMAVFCHELFDLRSSSLADTQAAIEDQLGVNTLANGRTAMHWSLMTISARLA